MSWIPSIAQLDGGDVLQRFAGQGLVLVAVVGVAALVLVWARRRSRAMIIGRQGPPDIGFSIQHLEKLRSSGQITEQEFNQLRQRALGLSKGLGTDGSSTSSTPIGGDDGVEGGPGSKPAPHKE